MTEHHQATPTDEPNAGRSFGVDRASSILRRTPVNASRIAGLHPLEAGAALVSEPQHFESWADLKARLSPPPTWGDDHTATDSVTIHRPGTPTPSRGRARATLLVLAFLAGLALGFLVGAAATHPTHEAQPAHARALTGRVASEPDAPGASELIQS